MTSEKSPKIQLLGLFQVDGGSGWTSLPRSRQVRALLLHLCLEGRPVRREALCELLFAEASDPRAGLRWALSKLRPLVGEGDSSPIVSNRETVALDGDRVAIDVREIRSAIEIDGVEALSDSALLDYERRLGEGLPEDLDDFGSVGFGLWLNAEREALRTLRRKVVIELRSRSTLSDAEQLRLAGERLLLDPFDPEANAGYMRLQFAIHGRSAASRALDERRAHHRAEGRSEAALSEAWFELSRESASHIEVVARAEGIEATEAREEHALPAKPSVAVLDFEVLGDPESGSVLARGLSSDLNSRLAQLPSLFVVARESASRLSGSALSLTDVGRTLGVRYLVRGRAQWLGERVRITLELLVAESGLEIWSEHYDRVVDDLFEIQDDITNSVVAALEPEIERAEMQRALLRPPESLSSWDAFHRGLWHCFRFTVRDNEAAEHWFERAIELDPHFSRAHAGRSFAHFSRAFLHTVADPEAAVARALESARESVGLDGRDAMGYWALGRALFLSRRHDEALSAIDQSLAINPNYAQGYYARGFVGVHANLVTPALDALERAERLSPFDPLLFAMKCSRGMSLALQGRYEEALPWAIRATQEPNAHFHIYAIAAAMLELAERSDDARNNARWVLKRKTDYSVEMFQASFPHRDEASREPIHAAMERAGLPRHA